ncbi:MAG: hypothetical protein KC506_02955 [Nanoarchaeota archaeon]|nr:hypothetical protein [Nanoarchaeota archaeon]
METGMYMLPVRCKGCNGIFDLWQTLQEQESKGGVLQSEISKRMNQSFCPRCRLAVLSELGEIEIETPQTEDTQAEIELTFDFE